MKHIHIFLGMVFLFGFLIVWFDNKHYEFFCLVLYSIWLKISNDYKNDKF